MKYKNEEQIKLDFARLFNWFKKRQAYDYTESYRTPEWSEIFAKVGELLSNQRDLHYISAQEDIKLDLRQVKVELENLLQSRTVK